MKSIAIDTASDDQLKAFATDKGLSFAPNIGRAKLIEKIKTVFAGAEIDVSDDTADTVTRLEGEDASAASARISKKQQIGAQGANWIWLMIQPTESDGGNQPVDLYCNGKQIWVPRGKWCKVREGYGSSIKNAQEEKYSQYKDAETGLNKIDPVPRLVHRYPHTIWTGSGEPPKEDQYEPTEHTGAAQRAVA